MGIIETIKKIAREDGFEKGLKRGMELGIEKGIEKGIKKWKEQVVMNLLAAHKFTIEEIANFVNVPESIVKKISAASATKKK